MEDHPVFGAAIPERGWVPAPRYLLRRHRLLRILHAIPRGDVLEIGCGAGALSRDLAVQGFTVTAIDTSPAACELARRINENDSKVTIYGEEQNGWEQRFDMLIALEVLEHIQDDLAALTKWKNWLKPQGCLLLSVPAHQNKWNASDVWVGHVRRYERADLKNLLEEAGFSVEVLETYGFPLANIIDPIRARHHARLLKGQIEGPDRSKQTASSGIDRTLEMRLYFLQHSWVGVQIMRIFLYLQGLFAKTNLGNGYLLLARLR